MTDLDRRLMLLWDEEDLPIPEWYARQLKEEADRDMKQKLISEYISTAAGRERLAAAMAQPIRSNRDYVGVARRTFLVDPLPDGALPIYDRDIEAATG